jgi:hypothetical protein
VDGGQEGLLRLANLLRGGDYTDAECYLVALPDGEQVKQRHFQVRFDGARNAAIGSRNRAATVVHS